MNLTAETRDLLNKKPGEHEVLSDQCRIRTASSGTPSSQRRTGLGFLEVVFIAVRELYLGMTPHATRPLPPPFSGFSV